MTRLDTGGEYELDHALELIQRSYTAVYNNLDYPGLCFPTGLYADPAIDVKTDRKEFMQDTGEKSDRYNHELCTSRTVSISPDEQTSQRSTREPRSLCSF